MHATSEHTIHGKLVELKTRGSTVRRTCRIVPPSTNRTTHAGMLIVAAVTNHEINQERGQRIYIYEQMRDSVRIIEHTAMKTYINVAYHGVDL